MAFGTRICNVSYCHRAPRVELYSAKTVRFSGLFSSIDKCSIWISDRSELHADHLNVACLTHVKLDRDARQLWISNGFLWVLYYDGGNVETYSHNSKNSKRNCMNIRMGLIIRTWMLDPPSLWTLFETAELYPADQHNCIVIRIDYLCWHCCIFEAPPLLAVSQTSWDLKCKFPIQS